MYMLKCPLPEKQTGVTRATHTVTCYNAVGIAKTWWNGLHGWSAAMDEYRLFRKDRQEK